MRKIKFVKVVSTIALSMLMSSCFYDPYYYGPPSYYGGTIYHPYDYFYYPSVRVYFQYSTGLYFYLSDGIWVSNRVLPPRFRLNPSDRIPLRIPSDKPYKFNPQHKDKYRLRPGIIPSPARDRYERESLRRTYKERLLNKPRGLKQAPMPSPEKKDKRDKDKRRW